MHHFRRILTITLVTLLSAMLFSPIADAQTRRQGEQTPHRNLHPRYVRGDDAIEKLGHRLPALAREQGLSVRELRAMLRVDRTLFLDETGQLAYFDLLAPGEPVPADNNEPAVVSYATPSTHAPAFALASNPGAAKTIYLDFDGHTTEGTTWNNQNSVASIVSPPFDNDGNPSNFSATELDDIVQSWAVVAEDFAPWNVNVTTIDPGVEALRRTGAGDQRWGVRVVVTSDTVLSCGCGGAAYVGAFDDPADEPVFIFNQTFKGISEATTHEVGHAMGLAHDGDASGDYYFGHSNGAIGWAPIMGSSYWEPVTQWSQQEYVGASNGGVDGNFGQGGDDIAIISSLTNGNNFGLRADDHGDSSTAATALEEATTIDGLISTRSDRDVFSFASTGALVELSATPAALGPNLDISLTLRDQFGALIASSNPADSLDAALSVEVAAGEYFVEVDGVGVGNPGAGSGYSDYASLGSYTLVMNQEVGVVVGDVNCDGTASIADALLISQFTVGNRSASAECPLADPETQLYIGGADVDANGRVSVADAIFVSQCSVGIPNTMCPETS